jgi:hypothetical protein
MLPEHGSSCAFVRRLDETGQVPFTLTAHMTFETSSRCRVTPVKNCAGEADTSTELLQRRVVTSNCSKTDVCTFVYTLMSQVNVLLTGKNC